MNIKVLYHSSTGNTEKIANAIADALNVNAERIGGENEFSTPVDLLFVGDGVYFGKPNKRTVTFIERLNPNTVKNVAVFATYGGQSGIGADIRKLLQAKGLKVIGEPFTCKGKAWGFLNRKHPNVADLSMAREYAKTTLSKAK